MILPNLIVDKSADRLRPIRAFGYCDFSAELTEDTEQVQCPTEQLPPIPGAAFPTLDRYRYDSETGEVVVVEE
jgi:hypothetical protein